MDEITYRLGTGEVIKCKNLKEYMFFTSIFTRVRREFDKVEPYQWTNSQSHGIIYERMANLTEELVGEYRSRFGEGGRDNE